MAKIDEEALVAIQELVNAGFGVSVNKYSGGFETTLFSRFEKSHSHFQDETLAASILKARKSIEKK